MWVRIVDGVIEPGSLGPLPPSSTRLDTGEEVLDLGGVGAKWQRAAGWYDLDVVDPADLPVTAEQRDEITAALDAAKAERDQRIQWLLTQQARLGDARTYSSEWIDAYGSGTPPIPGYPNPGQEWNAASAATRTEALRRISTVNAATNIVLANGLEVAFRLLLDLLRDTPVDIT